MWVFQKTNKQKKFLHLSSRCSCFFTVNGFTANTYCILDFQMFISNWQNAWLLQGELADKPRSSQSSAALRHLLKDASYWKPEHLCRKPAETSLGVRDPGTPDRSGMQPQKYEPSAHSTLIVYPLWERVHSYLTGACLLQQWVMKFLRPATVWKMITACRKEGR